MTETYNRIILDMGDDYFLSIIQPKNDHNKRIEIMLMSMNNSKGQIGPIFDLDGKKLRDVLTHYLKLTQQPYITNYQLSKVGHLQEGED